MNYFFSIFCWILAAGGRVKFVYLKSLRTTGKFFPPPLPFKLTRLIIVYIPSVFVYNFQAHLSTWGKSIFVRITKMCKLIENEQFFSVTKQNKEENIHSNKGSSINDVMLGHPYTYPQQLKDEWCDVDQQFSYPKHSNNFKITTCLERNPCSNTNYLYTKKLYKNEEWGHWRYGYLWLLKNYYNRDLDACPYPWYTGTCFFAKRIVVV